MTNKQYYKQKMTHHELSDSTCVTKVWMRETLATDGVADVADGLLVCLLGLFFRT